LVLINKNPWRVRHPHGSKAALMKATIQNLRYNGQDIIIRKQDASEVESYCALLNEIRALWWLDHSSA
jgi:hypothetical protein